MSDDKAPTPSLHAFLDAFNAHAEDMGAGAKVLGAMDASETPGTRASVDACEIKVEMDAPGA